MPKTRPTNVSNRKLPRILATCMEILRQLMDSNGSMWRNNHWYLVTTTLKEWFRVRLQLNFRWKSLERSSKVSILEFAQLFCPGETSIYACGLTYIHGSPGIHSYTKQHGELFFGCVWFLLRTGSQGEETMVHMGIWKTLPGTVRCNEYTYKVPKCFYMTRRLPRICTRNMASLWTRRIQIWRLWTLKLLTSMWLVFMHVIYFLGVAYVYIIFRSKCNIKFGYYVPIFGNRSYVHTMTYCLTLCKTSCYFVFYMSVIYKN